MKEGKEGREGTPARLAKIADPTNTDHTNNTKGKSINAERDRRERERERDIDHHFTHTPPPREDKISYCLTTPHDEMTFLLVVKVITYYIYRNSIFLQKSDSASRE